MIMSIFDLVANEVQMATIAKQKELQFLVTPWFSVSGQKDSNLRPPAPKAGALAGLRHTPKKKTIFIVFFLRGEGGIRTPGTPCGVRQFSKLLVSATHPPLLGCELRCKSRHFSDTHNHFSALFFHPIAFSLFFSEINFKKMLAVSFHYRHLATKFRFSDKKKMWFTNNSYICRLNCTTLNRVKKAQIIH